MFGKFHSSLYVHSKYTIRCSLLLLFQNVFSIKNCNLGMKLENFPHSGKIALTSRTFFNSVNFWKHCRLLCSHWNHVYPKILGLLNLKLHQNGNLKIVEVQGKSIWVERVNLFQPEIVWKSIRVMFSNFCALCITRCFTFNNSSG